MFLNSIDATMLYNFDLSFNTNVQIHIEIGVSTMIHIEIRALVIYHRNLNHDCVRISIIRISFLFKIVLQIWHLESELNNFLFHTTPLRTMVSLQIATFLDIFEKLSIKMLHNFFLNHTIYIISHCDTKQSTSNDRTRLHNILQDIHTTHHQERITTNNPNILPLVM